MSQAERILGWLLRLGGGAMLLALVAVFMPFTWMTWIHRQLGLGELPNVVIVGYLTRSASALYALHGAILLFLARDVPRYISMIQFLALISMAFGIIMVGLDLAVGMPFVWTTWEGPSVVVFGIIVLWLIKQAKTQPGNHS